MARRGRVARRVPAAAIEHLGGAFVIVEGHIVAAQHQWCAGLLVTFRDTKSAHCATKACVITGTLAETHKEAVVKRINSVVRVTCARKGRVSLHGHA